MTVWKAVPFIGLVSAALAFGQTASAFTNESSLSRPSDAVAGPYEIPSPGREIRARYRPDEQRIPPPASAPKATGSVAGGDAGKNAPALNGQRKYYGAAPPTNKISTTSKISFRNKPLQEGRRSRVLQGVASWYGRKFHGRRTANGEFYNMYAHTAAHRTLPFGTRVRVINLRNGRKTVVRINDRGPFVRGREIDLSYRAARELGMVETGIERVRLEILSG